MASKSLEHSIERAVKHYSSLFVLPDYWKIVLLTFLLSLIGGFLTLFLILQSSVLLTLQFSLLLFLLSTISDVVIRQSFFKSDLVYNTRRCAALSMFSVLLWFGFLLIGSLLTYFFNSWVFWFSLFSIGFAAVCILRLVVLSSTSFTAYWTIVGGSLTQPLFCLAPLFYVSLSVGYAFNSNTALYFLFSIPLAILTALIFTKSVDTIGVRALQIPTTTVLKAFLANWMENLNAPLEKLFENFGKEKPIDFSLLAFKAKDQIRSVIAVSSFHPGPFKNVGSSYLPFLIQEALEKKLNCVVAVPHGLFGHEFDLSSQQQNQKVLGGVLAASDFANFDSNATSFVRTQKDVASASCQIFGDCAVVTLTLAPETTEDFPKEVGDLILEEASKHGLKHVVIINSHNSINNQCDMSAAVEPLKEAALVALKKASKLKRSLFEMGVAKVVPNEFSLESGMGPGGIYALVLRVGKQTCAYVIIDGNNMVSGLREKIFAHLNELGIDEGEVLTTDTHAVNAIVITARGYHPLGEAIPHENLISHIKDVVREAVNNMKPASIAWRIGQVSNVNVIGEKQIEEMSLLADKALRRAKGTAVQLFAVAGLLLIAVLLVL